MEEMLEMTEFIVPPFSLLGQVKMDCHGLQGWMYLTNF